MSNTSDKKVNHRISCCYCNETFLIKNYSKHLITEHKKDVFKKNNLDNLKQQSTSKYTSPIEVIHKNLKTNDKTEYFVPCCNKFYTKNDMARRHIRAKPECKKNYLPNTLKLYQEIVPPIEINSVVDISGNGNTATTNNIVNNGTLIMDNSGNVVDLLALIKKLNLVIDDLAFSKAIECKTKKKFQKQLETIGEEAYSDYSDIESIYSNLNDDVSDKEVCYKRFDIAKRLPKLVKPLKLDLSRDNLKLRTKEDKADEIKADKLQKEQEEKERLEQEKADRKAEQQYNKQKIWKLKDNIKTYNIAIKDMVANADMNREYNKKELSNLEKEIALWESQIRNIGIVDSNSDTESQD